MMAACTEIHDLRADAEEAHQPRARDANADCPQGDGQQSLARGGEDQGQGCQHERQRQGGALEHKTNTQLGKQSGGQRHDQQQEIGRPGTIRGQGAAQDESQHQHQLDPRIQAMHQAGARAVGIEEVYVHGFYSAEDR